MCSVFGMSRQYKGQVDQYKRQIEEQKVKWAGQNNIWNAKIGRYNIERAENVLAFSRKVGAIQRNFGLERDKFLKQNEGAFRALAQQTKGLSTGGDVAGAYGRNQRLAGNFAEGARYANMMRKGVQQTELMQDANRKLLSMNNKALERRGLAPIPGLPPVKPRAPGMLEVGFTVAQDVIGLATGFCNAKESLNIS